jgi:hypothetical protein
VEVLNMSAIRKAQRKAARRKKKMIGVTRAQMFEKCDAQFFGSEQQGRLGWVEMYANEKGRKIIGELFPPAYIEWALVPEVPDVPPSLLKEWRAFEIHVPTAMSLGDHNLPIDITGGAAPKTPEAYACLLAIGVKRGGGCAGLWRGGMPEFELFVPTNGN